MDNKKHIILVGMPGSGKSSLGFCLSKLIRLPFIDTDSYILVKEKRSISQIFREQGEEKFREIEQETLMEILEKDAAVISTGGGMPCYSNNMDIINELAITVYLKVDPEQLFEYLKSDNRRPLVTGKTGDELMQYIHTTLEDRKSCYEKADITMSAYQGTPTQLAIELLNRISSFRK
jgi:shikimate kinase